MPCKTTELDVKMSCSFKPIVSSEISMKLFVGYWPLWWILRGCYDSVLWWEVFVQLGTLTCVVPHSQIADQQLNPLTDSTTQGDTSRGIKFKHSEPPKNDGLEKHIFSSKIRKKKHWTAPIIYYNTFWIISNPCCIRTKLLPPIFWPLKKMLATRRKNCYFT